ncbi:THAP domain-containing protein 2-like, partial [Aphis craccivora]
MPYKCCVYGCNNRDGIAKNIKLFRCPDDENRKKKWLDLVQRKNFPVTKSSRLWSAYFELSEFIEAPGKLILKNTANPSNFNFPTTPTKKVVGKK